MNLSGESVWVHFNVPRKGPLGPQELYVGTIILELTSGTLLCVLLTSEWGEAPVLGDNNLLATREPNDRLESEESDDRWKGHTYLYIDLRNASMAEARWESLVRTDMMTWPIFTRATVPYGFPQAPRIPVWSLSAPAQDNILLMRITWNG